MFTFYCYSFIILLSNVFVCLPQIVGYSDDVDEPPFVQRVVNGWPAKLGDVPYQLAFKRIQSRYARTYYTFCGGTIVGSNKVISAAHCFEERGSRCCVRSVSRKTLDRIFAVAGNLKNVAKYSRTDSTGNGQWRRLSSMYIPSSYRFPKNDISVGYTRSAFIFNSHVSWIPYATRYRDYIGKCLVSGYGRTSHKHSSEILLLAHLELYSNSMCNRVHRRNMRHYVCTSSAVSDVHKGDSGGPLVCSGTGDPSEAGNGILVGVVSGNRARAGSFFTRVSSYNRFLQKSTGCLMRISNIILALMCLLYGGIYFDRGLG